MGFKCSLPGAERFLQDLQSRLYGSITTVGPEIIDRSYNGEYGKEWTVLWRGETIGHYRTFGPKPGETEYAREYRGKIPGYVNDCAAAGNAHRPKSEQYPIDVVTLVWDNRTFRLGDYPKGGEIVLTPWQRQDGHDQIQFP
jgi:hypothetical protein